MADEETTHPVESVKTPEVEELDGYKFVLFEQGEQVNSRVKNQRKRVPKRSFTGFGLTTLSLTNDTATRLKKRSRKDDKRVIVDRVDGFTFVSAFTLNDFDEYDKNPVKQPLAPTKRKSTTKIESTTSKKKAKKPECSPPENLGANVAKKGQSNSTPKELPPKALPPKKSPMESETVPNASKKKVSPLTKSALVRLKKINVSSLNQHRNHPMNKQINDKQDSTKDSNQKNSSSSKAKKAINLKVPLVKYDKPREAISSNSLPSTKKSSNSKIPHMQIDKLTHGGEDSFNDWHEIILSDDEDNMELDVCGIDETSSSQFILNNIKSPEEKSLSDSAKPKKDEKGKPKRKPCRVCCAYPCRIVGAKRIKSYGNQFPSFDVSFTSRCQVHTPGEIEIHDSSRGKVNACIQTTSTDIRMHLDFARRFPYRVISIVSCQPSLYDDDLKLPDNLAAGTTHRCNENHRILEQKRREELHGLYCKLADTLSISKNRASKQWILGNALKEVKSLEAKDRSLTVKLNLAKSENGEKRKRWEELAGKPYVIPEESTTKVASKSKLLQLYEQYRQERKHLRKWPTKKEENFKSEEREMTNVLKEERSKLQEREKVKKELQKKIRNSKSRNLCDGSEKQTEVTPAHTPSNNPANTLSSSSPACTPRLDNSPVCKLETATRKTKEAIKSNNPITKLNQAESSTKESPQIQASSMKSSLELVNNTPVTASQVGPPTNYIQPTSTGSLTTTAKHASLGPRQIVRPFQHTPISSTSPSTSVIPKIDLTNEAESSTVKSNQLVETSTPKPHQPESLAVKSNPLSKLSQLVGRNPNLAMTTSNVTPQVATPLFKSPPPNRSSAPPQSAPPSCSTSVVTNLSTLFPTPIAPKPSNSSSLEAPSTEYVYITMVVLGKTTIFKIPKTAEGLTLMSKLSSLKPDSLVKIAAKFSSNQPEQSASATTSFITTPATPTQWSAVASVPNSTTLAISQPMQQSSDTSAVKTNNSNVASTSQPVKQPTATQVNKVNNGSIATVSRPIKKLTATTAVKTSTGSVGTTSEPKPPFKLNTTRLRNNSDMSISEKVKQRNAVRSYHAVNIEQTNSNVSQQQKKLIFLDLTSKNKPEAKAFSVIPTSSSINLTLNKLGSITANKVFNKRPAPMRMQNNPPNASPTIGSAPSTSQTNQLKLSPEYHLQPSTPVQIPKRIPDTMSRVPMHNVQNYPAPPAQIPSETPEDLPEIPPDIPSDLTRASLSPLETIPQISDSLLKNMDQKNTDDANEPGFCVISNVFSLTDTASGETPNSFEKTTAAPVEDEKIDTNVSATVDASMTASSDVQGETVNADLQNTTDNQVIADVPNVLGTNCSIHNSTAEDSDNSEQLKVKVIQ